MMPQRKSVMDDEQATKFAERKPKTIETKPHHDGRTNNAAVIRLRAGALHEIVSEAEAALLASGAPFYARSGDIVRPVIERVPAFHGRKTKMPRLKMVNVDNMRDHLSRAAQFEKWDKRASKHIAVDPPPDVARTLLARDGEWSFPALTGVITTPTLRPDGSILSAPGYDPATGLLLLAPPPMPTIPERPSRQDALTAMRLLDALLDEFPFVSDADRAAALSTLMTPVLRGGMQAAPLHAATAPEARTGKSYIFDLASTIATGQIAPALAAGRTEEETEKRIGAALLKGQPIISIDNLNGDLGGDCLCQAVERPLIEVRMLGRSENRDIVNTFCIFGNGNNMRLIGDVTPRTVLCSLDAKMERPELRQFRGNPVHTVLADRGRYVAAILIVARAYQTANCPSLLALASFVDWARLVRSPLVWLDKADPWQTNEKVRADDPSRTILRVIVAAWRDVVGVKRPKTAGELKNIALNSADKDMVFNKAISAVACVHGRSEIDPVRLGRWLSNNKGRIVNGLKICGEENAHSKQMTWFLELTPTEI
jgi:putative DNA primase/helicase